MRVRDLHPSASSFSPLVKDAVPGALTRRLKVELFFKWIKHHLRIKSFFGTSENAVETQIWIAVTVYVVVAVLKKRLGISADLYTILQVLSLTLFEKMPIFKLFSDADYNLPNLENHNQLILL